MKFKSLTMRIWVVFTAVLLVVILGITVLYHFAVRRVDRINRLHDLTVVHEAMLSTDDFRNMPSFHDIQNLRESNHFRIENGEIVPIGKHQMLPTGRFPMQYDVHNELKSYAAGQLESKEIRTTVNNIQILAVISSSDNGYLVSYMPYHHNDSILKALIIIGGIFIIAGFFIARVIAAYLAKPLSELEAFTHQIATKKWGEPIVMKSRDEIGRLADSMNKMQEDLKRADEEERLFLQSISHDLKTPVMVIMSHADAIIDGVYIDTPENTATIIKNEAISLSKKIKQLLYFNTLAYSLENNSESSEVFLDEIVLSTFSRLKTSRPEIFTEPQLERTCVIADPDKLTVAIENIIDNALRYSDGEIRVTLSDRILDIYNSGANIPQQNLERIFDNMYKDKTGNFGLGLAISKKIITHYGGTVYAVNREKGVSIVIEI